MLSSRALPWFALLLVALTGCSAKSTITSKRSALEPRLTALRDAKKNAAAFKSDTTKPADVPVVVSRDAPTDDSNTIVIMDQEIDDFDREIDCSALARTGKGPNCSDGRFGVGNRCAMQIASVLRAGHFLDADAEPHKNWVDMCIGWLGRAKYVLVVHVDSESLEDAVAETYVKGSGVLVDLASRKPLAKFTIDENTKATLGGEIVTKSGQRVRYVTESASPVDALVRGTLGEQLAKTFPSAKVDRWVN